MLSLSLMPMHRTVELPVGSHLTDIEFECYEERLIPLVAELVFAAPVGGSIVPLIMIRTFETALSRGGLAGL